jgi:TonB family protein
MLDQMVESKKSSGAARRGGFLLTTMMLVTSLFASGVLWSLFAKDFGVGNESLELSMLVAPVIPAEDPPAPEPMKETKSVASPKEKSELPSRREIISRIDETPIAPKDISTSPNINKERPKGLVRISDGVETGGNYAAPGRGTGRSGNDSEPGIGQGVKPTVVEDIEKELPPAIKISTPIPVQKPKAPQSLGVINGRAEFLPKPAYPAAAQSMRVSGEVSVQVSIDESGRVVSAKAVSGHPLLKTVSESAARNAVFKPTLLSNQPVKVTGIIIYKFTAQ